MIFLLKIYLVVVGWWLVSEAKEGTRVAATMLSIGHKVQSNNVCIWSVLHLVLFHLRWQWILGLLCVCTSLLPLKYQINHRQVVGYNDERQCYGYSSRAHERRHSVVLTLHLRVLDTLRLCRMVSFVLMPLTPMTCRLIVCEMNVNQSFSHSSMLRNGDILLTRLPCHIEMSCSVMKTKQVILQHRLNVFL